MPRVRSAVHALKSGDHTLVWYERAIAVMQRRSLADPTSWRFQAAIHKYDRSNDPLRSDSEAMPTQAHQETYWSQCQHGSWFFLPWHRMYLHIFERIVLAEVINLGGPSDWALPYWNYSASAAEALLPMAFRNELLEDGSRNHLYVEKRGSNTNEGWPIASASDTSLDCLKEPLFEGHTAGGSHGFGGVATRFRHDGAYIGVLENTPHGQMHSAVGGARGWMGSFFGAPLDPIFWLHHCNIDRLWEVWLNRDPTHVNPSSADWLTAVAFDFFDWNRIPIKMTPSQVLDTRAAPLEYEYDDINDPLPAPTHLTHGVRGPTFGNLGGPSGNSMAELIGATSAPFKLRGNDVEKAIKLIKPTGPAANSFWLFQAQPAAVAAQSLPRVLIHVEGIMSPDGSVPYDVYLNIPSGSNPSNHPERRAGRLSMFGLAESSLLTRTHVGDGLRYSLDATEIVQLLALSPGWNPSELRVSLVPARRQNDTTTLVDVGRISVYLE